MPRKSDAVVESGRLSFKRLERALTAGLAVSTMAETSARMARVRRSGTTPELAVRRRARAIGLRFTTRNADLPGSPDLANRSKRLAIFVHGCYWHRHSGCARATTPKNNAEFWRRKFDRNVERDGAALEALDAMGYRLAVIWECEARDDDRIDRALGRLVEPRSRGSRAPILKARNRTRTSSPRRRSNG